MTLAEINNKDPKFKIGDVVRKLKCKKKKKRKSVPNWSAENFVIRKVKNTVLWIYVISELNGEEIIGPFYKKELENKS